MKHSKYTVPFSNFFFIFKTEYFNDLLKISFRDHLKDKLIPNKNRTPLKTDFVTKILVRF